MVVKQLAEPETDPENTMEHARLALGAVVVALAQLSWSTPLEAGRSYALVLHSAGTGHEAPWLVNAAFGDRYPGGRHLGYADDLLFGLTFADGPGVVVGPAGDDCVRPLNSGR